MKQLTYYITAALLTFAISATHALDVGVGYRRDNLDWSEASNDSQPESLKEKWNVDLLQVSVRSENLLFQHLVVRFEGDYAWIKTGEKTFDQMIFSSNPFPRKGWAKAHSKGHAYDFAGALGMKCTLISNCIFATPLVGYSYHNQKFKDDQNKDESSSFSLLQDTTNSYHYQWGGPWVGARVSYQGNMGFVAFAEYQYHWGHYHSKVQDLFSSDGDKSQKVTNAHGQEVSAGICCDLYSCVTIGIVGNYKCWYGKNGKTTSHDESGTLKHVNWNSISGSVVAGIRF